MPINYFLDEFMPEVTASWEDMDNCFKGFDASWGEQRRAQSVMDSLPNTPLASVVGVGNTTGSTQPDYRVLETFTLFEPEDDTDTFFSLGQLLKLAEQCFALSHRLHVFTVYIRGVHARLLRWDRGSVLIIEEFDITGYNHLAIFSHCFARMTQEEKGFDPTVHDVTHEVKQGMYAEVKSIVEQWTRENDDLNAPLRSAALAAMQNGSSADAQDAANSGVRWLAIDLPDNRTPDKMRQVLFQDVYQASRGPFDYWQPMVDLLEDWDTMHRLDQKSARNIPTVVCGGILRGSHYQRTMRLRHKKDSYDWIPECTELPMRREHSRGMMLEIGVPLSRFRRPEDIFKAVICAVTAHEDAFNAGYLHRDISDKNILLYRTAKGQSDSDPEWGGLLTD
ncbi:hypothetical protein BDV98DRAFT_593365 [Pterulicium gracile]|uniref:Fungal-type protein kinase domain-containing protein n=1 Tax=Pterulicium gracile TaxID=1884261 RepID=A0A5C3QHD9_9AGAR|nr:hypothetical protein BDV98DRAFT_593365 [Pterula gracilis]